MTNLYTGNKKYATIKRYTVNNQSLLVTGNGTYTPDTGYTGFNVVRVEIPNPVYDTITANANTTSVTVIPEHDAMSKVIINPVNAGIDSNIVPANIKKGINILGVVGNLEFLTEQITINPQVTSQIKTPTNDGFSRVVVNPVTHEIDTNIIAGNIIKGVSILGVSGTAIEANETTRKITANGTYTPTGTYTGFSEVEVDVEVIHDSLTITPSTTAQTYTSSSIYHGYSPVKVKAVTSSVDPNIVPANIKAGVTILGQTGTCTQLIPETRTVHISHTDGDTFVPGTGKTGITQITVFPTNLDKTINPLTTSQTFTIPPNYSGFGTLKINPVDANIDRNLISENVRAGVTILGVAGSCIALVGQEKTITTNGTVVPDMGCNGITKVVTNIDTVHNRNITITENGTYTPGTGYTGFETVEVNINTVNNTNITISPTTTVQTFTPSEPYTGYETIKVNGVTSTIDNNIKATNIKSGITILGVAGSVIELNGETRTETITNASGTTYTPSVGKNAITSITVVPKRQAKTLTVGSTTLTRTTISPDSSYVGLSSVVLDMSWVETQLQALNAGDSGQLGIDLETKTVTQAGTYLPSDGYDGIGTLVVDLTWVDQEIARISSDFTTTEADNILKGTQRTIISDATSIRDYACYNMSNLNEVRLNNATSIGQYAFAGTGLKTITVATTSVCSLANDNAMPSGLLAIKVPSELVNTYKSATNWSTYSDIIRAI